MFELQRWQITLCFWFNKTLSCMMDILMILCCFQLWEDGYFVLIWVRSQFVFVVQVLKLTLLVGFTIKWSLHLKHLNLIRNFILNLIGLVFFKSLNFLFIRQRIFLKLFHFPQFVIQHHILKTNSHSFNSIIGLSMVSLRYMRFILIGNLC